MPRHAEQINGRERGQRASYETFSVKSELRVAARATSSQSFGVSWFQVIATNQEET